MSVCLIKSLHIHVALGALHKGLLASNFFDKAWPTSYRISYTVDGLSNEEGERILVYSSYKSEIQFVLPPGLEAFNHTG